MSKWDDIKKGIGYYADKTVTKTRELTDTASLKLKIASREADRDTEYKKLGELTYEKLKDQNLANADSLTRDISDTIARLDAICDELSKLKADEEARRTAKEAEKAERAARKEAERKAAEGEGTEAEGDEAEDDEAEGDDAEK